LLQKPVAQLALLSACQTNIGKAATGEGIYSLARGFASAGIPSIAATLWQADDQAIYKISKKFNEYLAAGNNKSEALHKAKLWFVENGDNDEHRLPYYWANMVLIGNTAPVVLQKGFDWWWIALLVFGVMAVVAIFIYKTKNNGYFVKNRTRKAQQKKLARV
jgi:hypothetical protein